MSRTPRIVALVAVLALPVAAVLATLLLSEPSPPKETSQVVRIGESAPAGTSAATPTLSSSEPTSTPSDTKLPPPPPVDDDDDDDDDRDDDRDDDGDDG
ncbi:hypothetical protein BAY59_23090 [Prauserella coralliicola]|nr:hypothetical protein BAY59_23090 [Prauserella coralliicola]